MDTLIAIRNAWLTAMRDCADDSTVLMLYTLYQSERDRLL